MSIAISLPICFFYLVFYVAFNSFLHCYVVLDVDPSLQAVLIALSYLFLCCASFLASFLSFVVPNNNHLWHLASFILHLSLCRIIAPPFSSPVPCFFLFLFHDCGLLVSPGSLNVSTCVSFPLTLSASCLSLSLLVSSSRLHSPCLSVSLLVSPLSPSVSPCPSALLAPPCPSLSCLCVSRLVPPCFSMSLISPSLSFSLCLSPFFYAHLSPSLLVLPCLSFLLVAPVSLRLGIIRKCVDFVGPGEHWRASLLLFTMPSSPPSWHATVSQTTLGHEKNVFSSFSAHGNSLLQGCRSTTGPLFSSIHQYGMVRSATNVKTFRHAGGGPEARTQRRPHLALDRASKFPSRACEAWQEGTQGF